MDAQPPTIRSRSSEVFAVSAAVVVTLTIVINDAHFAADEMDVASDESAARSDDVLAHMPTDKLIHLPRTEAACRELIRRKTVSPEILTAALTRLSTLINQPRAEILLQTLASTGDLAIEGLSSNLPQLCIDLSNDERSQLVTLLQQLKTETLSESARRTAFAMKIAAKGSCGDAFQSAATDPAQWIDLLNALPLLPGKRLHEDAYAHLKSLLPLQSAEPSTVVNQQITDLAIKMSVQLSGRERQKATDLIRVIRLRQNRIAAFAALSALPTDVWPIDEIRFLAADTLAFIAEHADDSPTHPQAAMKVAESVSQLLPFEQQLRFRTRLHQLISD